MLNEAEPTAALQPTPHQRVNARAAMVLASAHGSTTLKNLYQQGSAKIRFPRYRHDPFEAVLINTAGGLTGGDRLGWDIKANEASRVVITTQACEKAYRSSAGVATVNTRLEVASGAALRWLPQETILYDGSALVRQFDVNLAAGAELLAVESVVLGREAMGERVHEVTFHDRWRVKRDGRILFADDLRIENQHQSLAQFGGNRAMATILYVGEDDADLLQKRIEAVRKVAPDRLSGFSAFCGKMVGRVAAPDSYHLRKALIPVLETLHGDKMPSVWRL